MKSFTEVVHDQYMRMSDGELFVVEVEDLFEKYLAAFPPGTDPIYKKRTVHDCQCCKQFIRRLGKVVNIIDGQIITVWDDLEVASPYKEVFEVMGEHVRNAPIKGVFRTKEQQFGVPHNYDKDDVRHDHFSGRVATKHRTDDPEAKRGEMDAIFQVMYRGLTEIKLSGIHTVLELIESNGLYRGEEHKPALLGFRDLLRDFNRVNTIAHAKFVWANIANRNARFRNTVIGTLLIDLAEGKDIEVAVKSFETKVAPANYKRPTAIITQRMVEEATQTLTNLGLGGAIYRRYARLSDVSVNDVLFVDNRSRSKMKDGIAKLLESSVKTSAPNIKNAVPITADAFLQDIVPHVGELEVFLENRHAGNFISLTGGDGPERLFKWDNNFAWSYDGDVTDSVKQRVKAAGGKINCKLRVSLSWFNTDDLDLHCITPHKEEIYFGYKAGILDVDMNAHYDLRKNAVENLAFNTLIDGDYKIWVNQYRLREREDIGFAIELEYEGQLHQFSYPKIVKDDVDCFILHVKGGKLISFEVSDALSGGNVGKEKWGVKTESLVPVSALMFSPNHWGSNRVGAKHLIFALDGCKNPDPTRGIYNEYLRGDLDKHRKVFEVLGNKTKCAPTDDQISGVGFTAARGDTVTVVVDGRRSYLISF